ncbi:MULTISPECIES: N-acetyl sugar amidotransferase [Thalassospira]|jgi:N-acetyl sugar amidotransferase|uniref:N-acetyl sugar amidotransferase n=1 Tax=Thalassospira TaxID=168934 RepID=UPI0007A63354|nr:MULTISPECIES: N-acetyl sugar amidotransferase [unclassified Thalassospira]KZC99067.1 LPS biosynthesis protein [Thalassospira sp. MCCC 1A02898]ONH88638.1 LPS biosynthesis protein, PseA [Thalassospira sp. MCCC 1A02803]BDW90343.1 LPS biosynthesis protein PseA [Thalassospira tepidiphila]
MSKFSKYETDAPNEAYYGLPHNVEFCRTCVISNQRPNSTIEQKHTKETKKKVIAFSEGVCDACKTKDWKDTVNWDDREQELIELCDKYRSKDGSYDCLVPGSGGKDSFMQAHLLKYKYGMNPLTVTWAPHIYTDWGWRNFQKWIHAGFDNILVTPNGRVHRLLTRLAFDRLLHPFQPFIVGQRHLAAKMAALHNIQLIFYGESGSEYGNPSEENESAKRDFAEYEYFTTSDDHDVYLGGTSFHDLKSTFGLRQHDLEPYLPIDPKVVEKQGIEVHYLGYYVKWHPQAAYYYAVEHGGFEAAPERTPGTYSKYNSIDDKMDDLHYYTTFVKFGIGRATYDASQEVRSGDIERDEGIALVKKFDGEYPVRFEQELFDYMSITEKEFGSAICAQFEDPIMSKDSFDRKVDEFRSPHLWKYENGSWLLRHKIFSN